MRLFQPNQRFFVIDYETTGLTSDAQPIEVGIIACDEHFNILETYQSLIKTPVLLEIAVHHESTLKAYRVHGILPSEIAKGKGSLDVAQDLRELCARHTRNGKRPVLVSDNIQFEWRFTDMIMGNMDAFHYCGWDSSLLLEATGVGDPKPAHRALADAGLLHAAIVKALDRVRTLHGT